MDEIMVGVIDSGIDIFNFEFYQETNGKRYSIIDAYYYQQEERVFENNELTRLLNDGGYINLDPSGHGTAVAGIVVERLKDIKYRLVVAGLSRTGNLGDSDTASILKGLDFVIKRARELSLPLIVNLSYGNNYGNHSGDSMLEKYIDAAMSSMPINVITGMGNSANLKRHTQLLLGNKGREISKLNIGEYQSGFTVQIWRKLIDSMDVWLTLPNNTELGPLNSLSNPVEGKYKNTRILSVDGISPFSEYRETLISFLPEKSYIEAGTWQLVLVPKSIQFGRVDMWLPSDASINSDIFFEKPTADTTLTIPASSSLIISVGAYNPQTLAYAGFSGRGYTAAGNIKPDVSAPGEDIPVFLPQNIRTNASGTSFASPFAAAEAAKLMYEGMVLKGDKYMFGQRLKSELIKKSRPLPGYTSYPNEKLGWGFL